MWGITVYFNPVPGRGILRLENYKRFRDMTQSQGLRLCTVELLYDDSKPELCEEDAELLLHVHTTHEKGVLWQKERLMNIALEALPLECDKVCWLDADIIFDDNDWVAKTTQALTPKAEGGGGCGVVQPFSVVCMLPRGWDHDHTALETFNETPHRIRGSSILAKLYNNFRDANPGCQVSYEPAFPTAERFRDALEIYLSSVGGKIGICWAARRELLEKCGGFYDCNVIGSGDAVLYAATNAIKIDTSRFSEAHTRSVNAYLETAHRVFDGKRVGCVDGLLFHMWHGKMKNRQYNTRHSILCDNDYDPERDLILNQDGVWEWSDAANDVIVDKVRTYFVKRKEFSPRTVEEVE